MINIVIGTNHWSAVWIGLIAAWKQRCDDFSETPELVANPATSGCAMFLCPKQQASVPLWPCAGGGGSSLGDASWTRQWGSHLDVSQAPLVHHWWIIDVPIIKMFKHYCYNMYTVIYIYTNTTTRKSKTQYIYNYIYDRQMTWVCGNIPWCKSRFHVICRKLVFLVDLKRVHFGMRVCCVH